MVKLNEVQFVAEIDLSLTEWELNRFAQLSKLLNVEIPDVVRTCMNERCEELLAILTQQEPSSESRPSE